MAFSVVINAVKFLWSIVKSWTEEILKDF